MYCLSLPPILLAALLSLGGTSPIQAGESNPIAFPGAEGFGNYVEAAARAICIA